MNDNDQRHASDQRLAGFLRDALHGGPRDEPEFRMTSADNPPPEWRRSAPEATESDEPSDEAPDGRLHGYERVMTPEEAAIKAHLDEQRAGGVDPRWAAAQASSGLTPRALALWAVRSTPAEFMAWAEPNGLTLEDKPSDFDLGPAERTELLAGRFAAKMERDRAEGRKW